MHNVSNKVSSTPSRLWNFQEFSSPLFIPTSCFIKFWGIFSCLWRLCSGDSRLLIFNLVSMFKKIGCFTMQALSLYCEEGVISQTWKNLWKWCPEILEIRNYQKTCNGWDTFYKTVAWLKVSVKILDRNVEYDEDIEHMDTMSDAYLGAYQTSMMELFRKKS